MVTKEDYYEEIEDMVEELGEDGVMSLAIAIMLRYLENTGSECMTIKTDSEVLQVILLEEEVMH
mgnify:CR=1 FL=1